MKKLFLVFGFLALTSLAASAANTVYNFTFDGYCDGMTINLYKPAGLPKVIFGGTHNFFDCSNTIAVGGFKHSINAAYQLGTGAVLDVMDEQMPYVLGPASSQYLVNTVNHTWVLYYGPDGVGNYVLNLGTYSNAAKTQLKGAGQKGSGQR